MARRTQAQQPTLERWRHAALVDPLLLCVALVDGLESISPVFEFMIEYYVLLGIILIAVGALFTFFDSYTDLQDKVKKLEKRISTLLKSN